MVNHVINNIRSAGVIDINLVVGNGVDIVIERTIDREISYSTQHEKLGTGHAVNCAIVFLLGKSGF